MRRTVGALLASATLLIALSGPVAAGGVNPAQLQKAGWDCFNVPGLGVHCAPPGIDAFAGNATPLLYFFSTTDPNATEADFSGTEQLLAPGVYNGQPCPQEGREQWVDLGFAFACHHR